MYLYLKHQFRPPPSPLVALATVRFQGGDSVVYSLFVVSSIGGICLVLVLSCGLFSNNLAEVALL